MRVLFVLMLTLSFDAAAYRICEFAAPISDLQLEKLRHTRNRITTSFEAHHSASDIITVFGREAIVEGKFSYGILGKDLVDEAVEIWIDVCKSYLALAHRGMTDKNGILSWKLPSNVVKTPGEYKIVFRVAGDGTTVSATLRVLPEESKVAVFDIDGTLTAMEIDVNLEVISDLIGGTYSPPKREASAELLKYLHDRLGMEIVYLTGRHYFLNELTKTWLVRNDFPRGTLIITRSMLEIYPTNNSVGKFKVDALNRIKQSGFVLDRAYGNAPTDVFAYQSVGIGNDRIYVLGNRSGLFDVVGLGSSFLSHYQSLTSGGNGEPR